MIPITNLTQDSFQNMTLIGEAGENIPFYLWYSSRQIGWFFNISYGKFVANGIRLCAGNNLLYQWQNIVPFGLAVVSNDGEDPFYLNDFVSRRISLYLLNNDDCILVNAIS